MRKKNIITLILIVLVLLIIADFKINGIRVMESYFRQMETDSLENVNDFDLENIPNASTDSTLAVDSSEISSLRMRNLLGSVSITGENRENIELDYKITVYAEKEETAREFLNEVNVDKRITSGDLDIFLKEVERPQAVRAIKVDYEIRAPERLALDIKNRHGKLEVNNFTDDVVLENYYDEMIVNNIKGDASIRARYGNLYLSYVEGITEVENSYNKASITHLGSDLLLDNSYGEIEMDNISGKADITTRYGSTRIKEIDSDVEIEARYSEIQASEVKGRFDADLKYGELVLTDVKNDLNINARYTDINVFLVPGLRDLSFNCRARHGNISSSFDLPVVQLDDSVKELRGSVGRGDVRIELETEYGDIDIN